MASTRTLRIMGGVSAVMVLIALVLVFLVAPQERTMGEVQRIFYFHVGAAWVGALAFLVALRSGIAYLFSQEVPRWFDIVLSILVLILMSILPIPIPTSARIIIVVSYIFAIILIESLVRITPRELGKARYDLVSLSSIEIGLVFITMVLVTGSIWARPAWNTWWVWTPRLASATIMWLVYLAYFMLRGAVEDPDRRRRFAAVYSIVGFASVILTFVSTSILQDTHPALFFGANSPQTQGDAPLSGNMYPAFFFSLTTFTVLYVTFLLYRLRLETLRERVEMLKARFMAA